MMLAMEYAGDFIGDTLGMGLSWESPASWVESNEPFNLKHINPRVRQNLKTNKSMREGVCCLFKHIATCCRQKSPPTTLEILDVLDEEGEWPPHTKNFFQRGGTVSAAVQAVFDYVEDEHKYLGSGGHEETFREEISRLAPCRNDLEVGFARRQYLRLEEGNA